MKPEIKLDLELLLSKRTAPPNTQGCIKNILQQAHLTSQKVSFWQEVELLLNGYLRVRPVPLIATVLCIGFLLGSGYEAFYSNNMQNEITSNQYISSANSYYVYSL